MINTTHKMAILGDVYLSLRSSMIEDENWNNFFNNNDVGFPFSFLYSWVFASIQTIQNKDRLLKKPLQKLGLSFAPCLD